ncbi:MAG: tRNA (adenosine(37)-N6)-dimethylallyltransferase MiaA [Pseudomonadota bacterium]
MKEARIIFIAGPTASGKSSAALRMAEALDGEIINADAMQVYKDLHIITARPSEDDEASLPHHLYGVLDGAEACSAGRWVRLAVDSIDEINTRGKAAILVGGTGLYFKALVEGLSPIPDVPAETRNAARARHEALGATAFRDEVVARDPTMARLPEGDTQRLLRAWEVFEATGAPLSFFQDMPRDPLITDPVTKAVILPDRQTLYAACNARAQAMFSAGAIDEVRALIARDLDPALPAMKALGVSEIASLLRGECEREEALSLLQRNTRRFAKRQMTWFRHQAPDWPKYETPTDAITGLTASA